MNRDEALSFLRENQPLADVPGPGLLQRFRETTRYFYEHPHPDCIPLLINAFGLFEDLTLYEALNATLQRFPVVLVLPHLRDGCRARMPSIRLASADAALHFPHPSLVAPLVELLAEGSPIIRLTAVSALEQIGGEAVLEHARQALDGETDEDVIQVLKDILGLESDLE